MVRLCEGLLNRRYPQENLGYLSKKCLLDRQIIRHGAPIAIDMERQTYILAMDPERLQYDHKILKNNAKGRVRKYHPEFLWLGPPEVQGGAWFRLLTAHVCGQSELSFLICLQQQHDWSSPTVVFGDFR